MGDCSNAMMRDLLPDLLHGNLPAAQVRAVRAHLESCAECRAELALLTRIRSASPTPSMNVERIVGALPGYRAPSRWRHALRSSQLRAAAAIVLLAGGATIVLRMDRETAGGGSVADTIGQVAGRTTPELGLGETFQDVSDTDLRALVDGLDELDAVMPEEPGELSIPLGGTGET